MDRVEVLATKQYLSHIGEWPRIPGEVHVERWLQNFEPEEEDHAVALLDAIIYISSRHIRTLLEKAVHALSSEWCAVHHSYEEKKVVWQEFFDNVLVTFPTGEDPNVTDSGHSFARMARKLFGLPEERCLPPDKVVQVLRRNPLVPVLFVDDFVGSGEQLTKTWDRTVELSGRQTSLRLEAARGATNLYYVPIACTSFAMARLAREASDLKVRPVHLITDEYGALHPESLIFPEHLRAGARSFVEKASARGGITKYPFGFYERALALAFEDSVPDATLEMIWHEGDKWATLMPRR